MSDYSLSAPSLQAMRDRARQAALLDTRAIACGYLDRIVDRIVLHALEKAHPTADRDELVELIEGFDPRHSCLFSEDHVKLLCPDPLRREIADLATPRRTKLIRFAMTRPDRIIAEVARAHGLTLADLTGPSRHPNIVRPRHEAVFRLKEELRLSFPEIGRRLGGRDHTTALHGYRQHIARQAERTAEARPC